MFFNIKFSLKYCISCSAFENMKMMQQLVFILKH